MDGAGHTGSATVKKGRLRRNRRYGAWLQDYAEDYGASGASSG
jgi:hypothetical protein